MQQEEDTTMIELDYAIAKNQFENVKYFILERGTLNTFFERLASKQFYDDKIYSLHNETKLQHQEIKDMTHEFEESIKNTSKEIYRENLIVEELNLESERLENEFVELSKIYDDLLFKEQENIEMNVLKSKLTESEKERENILSKINSKNKEFTAFDIKQLQEQVKGLATQKDFLAEKQKNLEETNNEIEDLYFWYLNAVELIEKLFGFAIKSIATEESRINLELTYKNNSIVFVIQDDILIEVKCEVLSERIKEMAIKSNDPRILFYEFKRTVDSK